MSKAIQERLVELQQPMSTTGVAAWARAEMCLSWGLWGNGPAPSASLLGNSEIY